MERKYWEKIAPDYNTEIFDVLKNDERAIISNAIDQLSGPESRVIDIGCAIGKWLPLLSSLFKSVRAVDISAGNLRIAHELYPGLNNVKYDRADFSAGASKFKGFDVAICINALLTDSMKKRQVFFRNIAACLKRGGSLVLVVPSLESWLLTRIIQQQWKIDQRLFANKLSDRTAAGRYRAMLAGNVEIDDVATKHYLGDELELLLSRERMTIEVKQKIEYKWNTEFVKPPSWLVSPRPWDWMIVAKKR